MIFTMNMKVEQWYLQDMNFKFIPSYACFNYSPKSICSRVMIPLILLIDFFVAFEDVQVEEGFTTGGAHQPHS